MHRIVSVLCVLALGCIAQNAGNIVFLDHANYATQPPYLFHSSVQQGPVDVPVRGPPPGASNQAYPPQQQSFSNAVPLQQSTVADHRVQQSDQPVSGDYPNVVDMFYPPVQKSTNPAVQAVALGNERFALRFFRIMGELVPNYDFMISPFSVWALLASAAEGAGTNTLEEFKTVLGLNDLANLGDVFNQIRQKLVTKTDTVDLTVFQAIFHNKSLQIGQEYQDKMTSLYQTDIYPLEGNNVPEQIRSVNEKIREATNGYHNAAFTANDLKTTSLLLLSLIHFRGQWKFPFNKTFTRDEPFYNEQGVITGQAKMMFQRGPVPYTALKEIESHVVDLPYGNQNRLRMLVILPRKNVSVLSVLKKLENIRVSQIFDALRRSVAEFEDEEVEILMPKFNTTSDFILNAVLIEMGMLEAFSTAADFNKINPDLYLTRIAHKSKITVDEEGTVASSVTAGLFANKSSGPRFYANRPFLYMIVDRETELVLFCGQMKNNPVAREPKKSRRTNVS